jgi:hypothetical protein
MNILKLRNWILNADQAMDVLGKVYEIRGEKDKITLFDSDSLENHVVLTNDILEQSRFLDNTLVLPGDRDFTFQKIQELTPPVECLNQNELASLFTDIADDHGAEVYEGYSGRFMYGAKCWGISTKNGDVDSIVADAAERGIKGHKTDSLGLDCIIYWPNINYFEEGANQE